MLVGLENYKGKKILVTGHTGFKGTWLSAILRLAGADVHGISLPPQENSLFTRVDSQVNSEEFIDIRDLNSVKEYFKQNKFDGVFHLAAQPIVRVSYEKPLETFSTNVMGTIHILDSVTEFNAANWLIVVTTDKVYQYSEGPVSYDEDSKLGGYDPYSSSKAAVEHLVSSWQNVIKFRGSNLKLCSVRAGNVIGGGDNSSDRLLPDIISSFIHKKAVVVRNPSFVRPWQHVLDPLNGYLLIGSKLISGESVFGAYNFGPGEKSKLTVNEIVDVARKFWPHGCDISFELQPSGMPETPYLWLSSDLARKDLGWRNAYEATEAVQLTLLWELEAMNEDATEILVKQINNFYKVRL